MVFYRNHPKVSYCQNHIFKRVDHDIISFLKDLKAAQKTLRTALLYLKTMIYKQTKTLTLFGVCVCLRV